MTPTDSTAPQAGELATTEFSQSDSWLTPGRFALVLALMLIATFPGVLFGQATFIIRDFGLFSYPVAFYQKQCFWRGELPLWNPLSQCGLPFLAQWNTLALYPGALLYLLLPLTWSLPLFCLGHVFWGGLGMFFLARRWTDHAMAAALAGIVFAFNGLTLNFLMWPSHIATFSWMPWVLWLTPPAWRVGGKAMVWAILAGAMQMLAGGPETLLFTWLILLVLLWLSCACKGAPRRKVLGRFILIGLLIALICSAQLLPFLQLLAHSQRDTGFGSSAWSMPFSGWANFLVPLFHTVPTPQGVFFQPGQSWTSSYYAGIGTLLFAIVAVRYVREPRIILLTAGVVLALVLALGEHGLLYRLVRYCVPMLGFVRYPVKFVIAAAALLPLLGAFGFRALMDKSRPLGRFEWVTALSILVLIGVIAAAAWLAPTPGELQQKTVLNGLSRAAFLAVIVAVASAFAQAHAPRRMLLALLLLITFWLDFVTHMPSQNPTAQPSVYTPGWAAGRLNWRPQPRLGESRAMLAPAAQEALKHHVIPKLEENYLLNRLALLADCNLLDGTPQVHGFFSLLPWQANNVIALSYLQTNRDFPAILDFLGVSQITTPGKVFEWSPRPTAMPLLTAGQQPVFVADNLAWSALFATNLDLRHAVMLPPEARSEISATQQLSAQVFQTSFSNHEIAARTEAPARCMLAISQTYYPAWKAFVDGAPVKLWRANFGFQALQVPAGTHEVRLRYEDKWFRVGLALSVAGLAGWIALWFSAGARSTQRGPPLSRP